MGKRFPHEIEELMDEHAPLLLRNEKGDLMFFNSYVQMYGELLKQLRKVYPRGYVEVAHYLDSHYNFSVFEVQSHLNMWARRFNLKPIMMIRWNHLEKVDFDQLKSFLKSLHDVTETSFREADFIKAFNQFKNDGTYV